MKQLIADLKERPKEDRAAFAGLVAGVVVLLLFLTWVTFFIRGIQEDARVRSARNAASRDASANPAVFLQNATQELSARYNDATDEYATFNAQVAAVGQLARPSEDVIVGPITVLATSTPLPESDVAADDGVDEHEF